MAKYVVGIDSRDKPPESYHIVSKDEVEATIEGILGRWPITRRAIYVTGPMPDAWIEDRKVSLS